MTAIEICSNCGHLEC